MSEELKPCPFCGRSPEKKRNSGSRYGGASGVPPSLEVYCPSCEIGFRNYYDPLMERSDKSAAKVVCDKWNTRIEVQ